MWEGILDRYFGHVFWEGILGRYFDKVFWAGILRRYFGQVFWEGILGRFFGKVSVTTAVGILFSAVWGLALESFRIFGFRDFSHLIAVSRISDVVGHEF